MDTPQNVLLRDVEFNWARLDTPVTNPFPGGVDSWELQVASTDPSKLQPLADLGANVKEADGIYSIQLRRKSQRADGSPQDPVRVVDGNKNPMTPEQRRTIGNGSVGNVIVWAAPYEYMKRKGVTFSLTAVQVTNLVEYVPEGVDFDIVGGDEEAIF